MATWRMHQLLSITTNGLCACILHMYTQAMRSSTMLVVCTFVLLSCVLSQAANQYCNDDMTACSCPESKEVCYFELVIQRLLTFTRYTTDLPPGVGGKIFFINDDGELEYIPVVPDTRVCNATNCTQANTADGRTYRTFIAVNGRLPGPTLIVYEGQTIVVDVVNMLHSEVTTIHWHGLIQVNSPWMDGTGIITQCPIEPGTTFRYIFSASQAGTFWYHAHEGNQRSDGLFGGFVIKEKSDAEEKYPLDHVDLPDQHTLTLLDWQREEGTATFVKSVSKLIWFIPDSNGPTDSVPVKDQFAFPLHIIDGSGAGIIPFWSGLINGMGKHPDVAFNNTRLKVFSVSQGTTYRFRIIGAQSLQAYRFSIDGHRMTVIATDGNYIQPVAVDYVTVFSGERYDVVVSANQTEQPNFWMRAETIETTVSFHRYAKTLPPYPLISSHDARAVLHYDGSAIPVGPDYANITEIAKTCTEEAPCVEVNCPFEKYHPAYNITCINVHQLRLFFPTPLDELPSADYDEEYFFNFAFENTARTSTINGRTFLFPKVSPQIEPERLENSSLCSSEDTCSEGCYCTYKVDIPFNKTIRFVFSTAGLKKNRRKFTHPIHLHGHHFHVVAAGYGKFNSTSGDITKPTEDIVCQEGSTNNFCLNPTWRNGSEPQVSLDEYTPRKDTVTLPSLGYVVVHFKSTNPGMWLLHCHLMLHLAEGMTLIVNEAQSRQPPPPNGICNRGNFTWTVDEFYEALKFNPDEISTDPDPDEDDCDPVLSAGAIAGIAVASAALAVIIMLVVLVGVAIALSRKSSGDDRATEMKEGGNVYVDPAESKTTTAT